MLLLHDLGHFLVPVLCLNGQNDSLLWKVERDAVDKRILYKILCRIGEGIECPLHTAEFCKNVWNRLALPIPYFLKKSGANPIRAALQHRTPQNHSGTFFGFLF